jgi:hypothetical protein
MKRPLFYSLIGIAALMTACSTTVKNPIRAEIEPDKVISRIDDLSSRPGWLKESEPFRIADGNAYSLGSTSIPGDQRVEAAFRVAENNAKSAVANAIEQKLEFIFQNAEEGAEMGADQARYIGAEASSLITSSIRSDKRYWEKIATTQDSGERVTRYKVFSLVSMPEADFKKAIMAAVRKAEGKKGLSKNFAEKVDKHWDRFTSQLPNSTPENKE